MSRKSQEGTYMCHGKGNNVVYKSRKWKHHMCMSRKWQQLKCMCHGNGNNWHVCVTETTNTTMYVFVSRKWWIHLVLEPSAGVLKIVIITGKSMFNPLKPELNPICYLLALLLAHYFLHVSRIRVKSLTIRLLMSYIYGAPILDVCRSYTTTHHSR